MFEQLGLIGCGLMGGSFALALKRAGRQAAGLLAAATDGDPAAWAGLVDLYGELVWTITSHPALPRGAAEEASRTTWLRLAQQLDSAPHDQPVGVWLARTARLETRRCLARGVWHRHAQLPEDPGRALA